MQKTISSVLTLFAVVAPIAAQKLTYPQRQAVDRTSYHQREATKKLTAFEKEYPAQMKQLEGMLIPPSNLKTWLSKLDDIEQRCQNIETDLAKSGAPVSNAKVKPLLEFVKDTRPKLETYRADIAPRLAKMSRLANPATYPNLQADFDRIQELQSIYSFKSFFAHPEKSAELAQEFPAVKSWCSEKFKEYKPIMTLTGGKNSKLYKRYSWTAKTFQEFSKNAAKFVKQAEVDIPNSLQQAEKMAQRAAKEKKPGYFTGGVRQKMDFAQRQLTVVAGFLPENDKRRKGLSQRFTTTKSTLAKLEKSLETEITAANRAPLDVYKGDDKNKLHSEITAAWKKKWPKDEVLELRFHQEDFTRTVKWVWSKGQKAWQKVDRSVLAATVIVKTSADVATTYPAFINVDNLSASRNVGCHTKGTGFVQRQMLVKNLHASPASPAGR